MLLKDFMEIFDTLIDLFNSLNYRLDKFLDDYGLYLFLLGSILFWIKAVFIRTSTTGEMTVKEYFFRFFKRIFVSLVLPVAGFFLAFILPPFLILHSQSFLILFIIALLALIFSGYLKKIFEYIIEFRRQNRRTRKDYFVVRSFHSGRSSWLRHPWNVYRDLAILLLMVFFARTIYLLFDEDVFYNFLLICPLVYLLLAFYDKDEDFRAPSIYWQVGSYLFLSLIIYFNILNKIILFISRQ